MSLQSRLLVPLDRLPAEPEPEVVSAMLAPPELAPEPDRPAHDPYADLRTRIHQACVAALGADLFSPERSPEQQERLVIATVAEELASDPMPLSREERRRLERSIADDLLGYGPLQPLLDDESISEIMVNGPSLVFVERAGRLERADAAFAGEAHLMRVIDKIVSQVGRRVDEASPMVDARLPDGSRINAIIPPLALCGPTLTIRKFSRRAYNLLDLVRFGTLTEPSAEFLAACVRGKLNVLVSGGTGVGKTTLLNALSGYIPETERIITIEDSAELQLQQRHVIPLESRPPNVEGRGEIRIRELVRNALRMRPDRLIVGEVRGPETLDMLQAMNTGHEGSLTTVHANSPRDALSRLETLVLTAGVDLPLRAIREQIASAFDLLIQVTRLVDGTRRVTHITEVVGLESDVVTLQDLFAVPVQAAQGELVGRLEPTGVQPRFIGKLASNGVVLRPAQLDPGRAA
jgi:pilus assembly protein CpaF